MKMTFYILVLITIIMISYGPGPGLAAEKKGTTPPFIDLGVRTYNLGGLPSAATLRDLDNDRDLDIVVANPGKHNIIILLNKGDGTFETGPEIPPENPPEIPIDGYPGALVAKDIDGDSDIDLLVLDSYGGVRTLFNRGGLNFSQGRVYPSEAYSFSISPVDVDSDGDWDIIVSSAKRTTILLNDGKGGFNTSLIYRGGLDSPTRVTADLNLDERDDIVIGGKEGVSVLLNNGDNTFANGVSYTTGEKPAAVAAGDMDSDLYPDLITANYKMSTLSILKNNRDGTFGDAVNYPSEKGPNSISLGDIDGDGDLDVIVTNGPGGSLSIFINNTVKPLTIATNSLPQGQRGIYYETRLEAQGGVPPYNWTIVSGSLPPSLLLDPLTGGIVSMSHKETHPEGHEGHEDMGEPLNIEPLCLCLKAPRGLYRFTVQVTDSLNNSATAGLTLEVFPTPGRVSGTVRYSGEKKGVIRVGLSPRSQGWRFIFSTTLTTPGEYKIENVYPESYLASAFMDVNGDGIKQGDEPYGTFAPARSEGKPESVGPDAVVVDDAAEVSGIDIEIVDGKP